MIFILRETRSKTLVSNSADDSQEVIRLCIIYLIINISLHTNIATLNTNEKIHNLKKDFLVTFLGE